MSNVPCSAAYSIARIVHRRKDCAPIYGWIWACWWSVFPALDWWVSPDAMSVVEEIAGTATEKLGEITAEVIADSVARDAVFRVDEILSRAVLSTRRLDNAFAEVAFMESRGVPLPAWVPVGLTDVTTFHFDRAPEIPACEYFNARRHLWPDVKQDFFRDEFIDAPRPRVRQQAKTPPRPSGRPPFLPPAAPHPVDPGASALRFFGLSSQASEEQLKSAFKKFAFERHPDRVPENERPVATAAFQKLHAQFDAALAALRGRL